MRLNLQKLIFNITQPLKVISNYDDLEHVCYGLSCCGIFKSGFWHFIQICHHYAVLEAPCIYFFFVLFIVKIHLNYLMIFQGRNSCTGNPSKFSNWGKLLRGNKTKLRRGKRGGYQSTRPANFVSKNWRVSAGVASQMYNNGFIAFMKLHQNLFVTSKNETTNSFIHQFTNLKCCIKAESLLKHLFKGVFFLIC